MIKLPKPILAIVLVVFVLLLLRLVYLQIVQGAKFKSMAEENAAKLILSPAPRGVIHDRYGKILVENQPVFSLHILPYVLLGKNAEERSRVLNEVSDLLGEKIELKVSASQPVVIRDKIPLATALKIEEREKDLPGVVVSSRPIRFYPYGAIAAHVLGYVGQADSPIGSIVGKAGVEKIYDQYLRGIDGGKKIQVDAKGTPLKMLEDVDPIAGANMQLTIDAELQKQADKALGNKQGAVVVMDPNTGEILAMSSHPAYDPASFISTVGKGRTSSVGWGRFPFMNRALAMYPPGSTFKVVTLTAALENNKVKLDEVFYCPGYYTLNRRIARCWKTLGHGRLSVAEGLVWSCDIVFYELGRRLGPDQLANYAKKYGLGSGTGIDLPGEKNGTVPDKEWKKNVLKLPWYEGDSINYGIGQGFLQATPLQMARLYSAIATGKLVKPYIVKEVKDNNHEILFKAKSEISSVTFVSTKTLDVIRKALQDVVERGTGIAAKVPGLPAAGKTGTAENPGLAHAWFLCYAPSDKPEIVIAAFVEHGEHGDKTAAYVARDILSWYKANRLKPTL